MTTNKEEPAVQAAMSDDLEAKWDTMFPSDQNSRHNALRFARALLAAQPSTGAQGEAAKYEVRLSPNSEQSLREPDEWQECMHDEYLQHIKTPVVDGWRAEVRALYTASTPSAAPSPVAQTSGDENHVLHVLRNPFGFSYGEVRAARLRGADLIERYRNAYINMRDFAEANGLDTKARNQ